MTRRTTTVHQEEHTAMLTINTDRLRGEIARHIEANAVRGGHYWDGHTGCFIGCLAHSDDATVLTREYGLPEMLVRLCESVFERLPQSDRPIFFREVGEAVGEDGRDLTRVGWAFLADTLRHLPDTETREVVQPVIAGMDRLAVGQYWPDAAARAATARAAVAAARAAAWAARAATARAAVAAARAAAWAVAEAAWAAAARAATAARAAEAPAWAAMAAAEAWAARAARAARAAEAEAWVARAATAAEAPAWAARAARAAEAKAEARTRETQRQRAALLALIRDAGRPSKGDAT